MLRTPSLCGSVDTSMPPTVACTGYTYSAWSPVEQTDRQDIETAIPLRDSRNTFLCGSVDTGMHSYVLRDDADARTLR
jgi:hypothetical protein